MATGSVQPFQPAGTVTLAATTTSSSAPSPITPQANGVGGPTDCVVYNSGAAIAFVAFGQSGVVASVANSYPVPPGASRIIYVGYVAGFVAAIMASGTGNVYFSFGSGSTF